MAGFDLAELLPFYLDETDEQIGTLNDALLRLERNPADTQALQEAFRMAHSIKGASGMLGFDQVKQLTHDLESYFAQLRAGSRTLDRPSLDLCFRCLDALRDYHRDLRSAGQSRLDLSSAIADAQRCLEGTLSADSPSSEPESREEPRRDTSPIAPVEIETAEEHGVGPEVPAETTSSPAPTLGPAGRQRLTAVFAPNLPWRDMKARLILSRLASRAPVLATDPPAESLDQFPDLPRFTVWLAAEADPAELRSLADVDGVESIRIEPEVPDQPPSWSQTTSTAGGDQALAPTEPTAEPASAPDRRPIPGAPSAAEHGPTPPAPVAKGRIAQTLRVDVERLDRLMNLAGELVINKARFSRLAGELNELFRDVDNRQLVEETGERLDRLARGLEGLERMPSAGEAFSRWAGQFRRLREDVREVLDRLEVFREGREQVQAMVEAIDQLGRVTNNLQKGVLDTRMVPIGPLFDRFRRVVRDLSVSSGKEVALRTTGEATELDKRMIDELADPLIHMVRNAVDHGLEPPDQREAMGKPRAGTITLQAAHRGNSVVVTISDDGRGIDVDRLRRKIVELGLVPDEDAAGLSDRQLIAYIWHPGLSTAARVTDISGRGVGMDIVQSRIENLNGTVEVRTERGRGTTFVIRLPLTLAILPGLLFRIYDEAYALPMDAVHEIVEVDSRVVRSIHGKATVEIRGRILSLIELNDVFRWGGADHPRFRVNGPPTPPAARRTVVVARDQEAAIGLRVDELIGIQELVLKSLERNFRAIRGLSGASILGDGRVCLVLDLDALVAMITDAARVSNAHRSSLVS